MKSKLVAGLISLWLAHVSYAEQPQITAIKLSRFSKDFSDAAGNDLADTVISNRSPQSVKQRGIDADPIRKQDAERVRNACRNAVKHMLDSHDLRAFWELKEMSPKKERTYIGSAQTARLQLTLPDGQKWDQNVEVKLFLKGTPEIRRQRFRDMNPYARSFLWIEFVVEEPGTKTGWEITGGAMVAEERSDFT